MKRCPESGEKVLYLDCLECENKICIVDNSVDNVDKEENKTYNNEYCNK